MKKLFRILTLALVVFVALPTMAQTTAEEWNKKGQEYYAQKNYTECFECHKKAAEMGYAPSMNSLGVLYSNGEGVEKNLSEACKWFGKAADKGNAWAQKNLGGCYYRGQGVNADINEAKKWLNMAVNSNDENAKKSAQQILDEIAEATMETYMYYTSKYGSVVKPTANNFGATIVSNNVSGKSGKITFRGKVKWIGRDAFRDGPFSNDSKQLEGISIPNTATSIGDGAFNGCINLSSVDIPESVTSIGSYAFERTALTSVVIPNSVTEIGTEAFSDCGKLSNVTLPKGLKQIETFTFSNCI